MSNNKAVILKAVGGKNEAQATKLVAELDTGLGKPCRIYIIILFAYEVVSFFFKLLLLLSFFFFLVGGGSGVVVVFTFHRY